MRRLALAALLVAAGCTQNHAELKRIEAESDRILAEEMQRADGLNELRKTIDTLELKVAAGIEQFPEVKGEIDALPPVTVKGPAALPVLPAAGSFEGAEGARLRARIADTQSRISQLRKLLIETDRLEARRARLEEGLRRIEAKRATKSP
jgi:hypothetical protein